jgi:hypothetical protein
MTCKENRAACPILALPVGVVLVAGIGAAVVVLMLVTYIPAISLWLPSVVIR